MLEVSHLTAGYRLNKPIIEDISFNIKPGELVGIIGPNGAGKSSTIKALMGLLPYINGTIEWKQGKEKNYAYIPEMPIFYEGLTLWEHLRFAASVSEMNNEDFKEKAEQLLAVFKMEKRKHDFIEQFSKGMQQKAMIMCGSIQDPDLYIIDEPFIGLDPRAVQKLLKLIDVKRQNGAAVLMSTHVLDTAERLCDRFILIDGGRVLAQGTLQDIQLRYGNSNATLFECFNGLTGDYDDVNL